MRRFLFALIVLGLSSVVQAQTTTVQASWTQQEAPATANTYTYTTIRNATAPVTLTAVTCTASGPNSACSGNATFTSVTLVAGDSFTLTAKNPSGLTSAPSVPFVLTGAAPPASFKITITITGP